MFSTVDVFTHHGALIAFTVAPLVILVVGAGCAGAAALRPALALARGGVRRAGRGGDRSGARRAEGLPSAAARRVATVAQLSAWGIQWLSCYVLLVALGLDDQAGMGAAAAVLFAVNVTAVLPATPSNIGVFQATCVAVLAAYGVGSADALAYGIILQAVEIATAIVMGTPALVKEGLSWREVRLRAMHGSPVELAPVQRFGRGGARETA